MPSDTMIRRRPGGRSARVRQSVLDSTLETLAEVGVEKLSIAEVADRAGVHETSIYRRWRTRENLVTDALLSYSEQQLPIPDSGSLRGDLTAFGVELMTYLQTPLGRALLRAAATSVEDPAIIEARASFWQTRYELAATMVERAIARGEIAPTSDPRLILETFIAPLHFRTLHTIEPLEEGLSAKLADLVLDGLLARGQPRRVAEVDR